MKVLFNFSVIYLVILFFTILISKKMNFFDIPNSRKIHKSKILNTSGVSLYLFLLLTVSLKEYSYQLEEIISIGFFVALAGFLDDRFKMSTSLKLILVMFPVIYLILNGYMLTDIGSYNFIGKLNLGKFSFIFTVLAAGLIINSYNYIDGIDGLLISITLQGLIYASFLVNDSFIQMFLYIFTIPLLVNLIFNLLPSKNSFKIFLGDCGSLFLGFFTGFLMIYLYRYQKIHPSYLIWIAWFAVADFLFVTFFRVIKKKRFYLPDQIHFHHKILIKFNNSQIKTLIIINIINLIVLMTGYLVTKYAGYFYSLLTFILLNIIFFFIRFYSEKSRGGAVW